MERCIHQFVNTQACVGETLVGMVEKIEHFENRYIAEIKLNEAGCKKVKTLLEKLEE